MKFNERQMRAFDYALDDRIKTLFITGFWRFRQEPSSH